MLRQGIEPRDVGLDVLPIVELLGDDDVQHGIQERHVGAVVELEHVGGVPPQGLTARVHDDESGALRRLLEEGGGDGVVLGGVGADDDDDVGVLAGGERSGDRGGADAFEEGRDRGRMTQPRTVVDVVGTETLADELLDEVRLLVRALGGAEAGERGPAVPVADGGESARGALERLLPGRLAEMGQGVRGVDLAVGGLRGVVAPDERGGEAMRMSHVVETEPPLHAQPLLVGGAVAALYRGDDPGGAGLAPGHAPGTFLGATTGFAPRPVLGVIRETVARQWRPRR